MECHTKSLDSWICALRLTFTNYRIGLHSQKVKSLQKRPVVANGGVIALQKYCHINKAVIKPVFGYMLN